MSDPFGDAGLPSPTENADAFLGAGNQYSADAFEGDAGLSRDSYSASGYFDTPAGLPGFSLNTGIAGSTVTPFELPVAGAHDADEFSAGLSPASTSGLTAANDALPNNLMSAAMGAVSGGGASPTPDMTQGIPPPGQFGGGFPGGPPAIPPVGATGFPGQPSAAAPADQFGGAQGASAGQGAVPGAPAGAPPQIPPWTPTGAGGILSAEVPNADASLISAVMSAGSGAGGQAALVADTVTLTGSGISTGGGPVGSRNTPATAIAPGSEAGSAPQFGGGAHWFYPTVESWYEEMVQNLMAQQQAQQQQAQLAGGGAVGDDDGGGTRPPAGGGGGGGGGDMFNTPLQQEADAGVFGGRIDGAISNALSQWASSAPDPAAGMDPLHATFSNEQMTALGLDNPNAGFEGLGHDPLSNTGGVDPNHPADDMWSSPLGGMGNAASDPGDGLGLM